MAITKTQAANYFNNKSGDPDKEFFAQKEDGIIQQCSFTKFVPDNPSSPTTGIVFFGVRIYPESQDYKETIYNLEALGTTENEYVDFKDEVEDLTFP